MAAEEGSTNSRYDLLCLAIQRAAAYQDAYIGSLDDFIEVGRITEEEAYTLLRREVVNFALHATFGEESITGPDQP